MKNLEYCTRSDCECPECGHVFPIWRRIGREREFGHIKDLWCVVCKRVTKHREYRKEHERIKG